MRVAGSCMQHDRVVFDSLEDDRDQTMELNLEGKIALVTGGTSGIGRAIASALLEEDAEVHIGDLNLAAAKGVQEFDNPNARLLRLDVGDASGVQQAVDKIVAERGRIDILVNCAGILKTRPLVDSTIADWDDVARVNLSGVYYCSKAVMPVMIASKYGKIINVASVSSVKGGGQFGNVLYGTTKAGVVAMTQGFARELGPYGINVNAISPGVVEGTPMTSGLMTPEVRQRIADSIPLKRMIQPAEVARLALYLASDISQGITGQAIVLDAGFLVR
ncbi:MAG: SDR family oxidoreductase [Betaproteobacteria bacterium]|nr:MAG: SDR family oxidoreductase [Betaproteobacteria bacterium]